MTEGGLNLFHGLQRLNWALSTLSIIVQFNFCQVKSGCRGSCSLQAAIQHRDFKRTLTTVYDSQNPQYYISADSDCDQSYLECKRYPVKALQCFSEKVLQCLNATSLYLTYYLDFFEFLEKLFMESKQEIKEFILSDRIPTHRAGQAFILRFIKIADDIP